ncbi:MAG: DEAD/DEAH box helicase family protein [Bdellovibrionales bacterium]|nr:DEAD/DEAH box helicase family protein [Bdellovibrionales bacterium]
MRKPLKSILTWFGWLLLCSVCQAESPKCSRIVAAEAPDALHSELANASPMQQAFYYLAAVPVLMEGHRLDLVDVEFSRDNDDVFFRTPHGFHHYSFTENPAEARPAKGMPEVLVDPDLVKSRVQFLWPRSPAKTPFDLERAQGVLRSSLRADPYAHCQLRPFPEWNGGKAILSNPQDQAVDALVAMENRVPGKAGLKRALVMPPGSGKTVVSAHYVTRLHARLRQKVPQWKKKPKILFVVQSNNILDEATKTYETELGLKRIARLYGPESAAPLPRNVEMIAVSRSGYFARRDDIHRMLAKDPEQPWVIVFDEGHEYMKVKSKVLQEAQFHTIRNDLEEVLDERHRILLLTATLWHRDRVLIKDYLRGNIHGGFLTDEEQERLRGGNILDLQVLCRTAWFRSIQQGYSPPLADLHIITSLGNTPMSEILDYNRAMTEAHERKVTIHRGLLKDVSNRILRTRISGVPDRGILFVPSIAHADAYAPILSGYLKEEVRVYHGGSTSDPSTYEWFNDQNTFATKKDRDQHKYVVVIRMLHQGSDTRAANQIVLLKPYGYSPSGFGSLVQNGGRAGRPFERKPYFRLYDYTGFARVLVEGIESIIVESFDPSSDGPGGIPRIVVNEENLTPLQFRGKYYDLFRENETYATKFPFFDLGVFQHGALRSLHEEAYNYSVKLFGNGDGAQEVLTKLAKVLTERFPCPEAEDLLSRFETEWKWSKGDGTAAKTAKSADSQAVRSIYEAVFEMAAIMKSFPEGEDLDLERVHTEEGFQEFMHRLDPDRPRSLLHIEDKLRFIDRVDGAWGALYDECRDRGIGTFSDAWASQKLIEALVRSIPDEFAAQREALLKRVKDPNDLQLKKSDSGIATPNEYRNRMNGEQNRARNREAFQRIYRVLYCIAQIMKQHPEAAGLDLSHLQERDQMELLFSLIRPDRVNTNLGESGLATFLDRETGGISILIERAPSFGAQNFSRQAPQLLAKIVQQIQIPDNRADLLQERANILKNLRDKSVWGWNTKTGARIVENSPNHTRTYFRALCSIAQFVNKVEPNANIDLEKLNEAAEMERFFDWVQLGMDIPYFTPAVEAAFREPEDGALAVLAGRAKKDFGVTAYMSDYGPKKLFVELLRRLSENYEVTDLPRALVAMRSNKMWGWTASDAQVAKRGITRGSSKRIYRGLYVSAYLLNQMKPLVNRLSAIEEAQQTNRMLNAFADLLPDS